MQKICAGSFVNMDNELFYKIENYDVIEDFFMTITSSSDIWNFCWSQGGVTAGRINSDRAIFPYYTADKVSDAKTYTGPYTAIVVEKDGKNINWEPFAYTTPAQEYTTFGLKRNIYKNNSGTKVWFEEINEELGLAFWYGWTSSDKYGLVRQSRIKNLDNKSKTVTLLDGCRNIMPACSDADFQNRNSVLLDAYKKTELNEAGNMALFSLSSVITDKAEPNEGLYANVCWFSTPHRLILSPDAPRQFATTARTVPVQDIATKMATPQIIKGKRPSCFICRTITFTDSVSEESWYQVFDTRLDAAGIAVLDAKLKNRVELVAELEKDINDGIQKMNALIGQADGFQNTNDTMTCVHHTANVMFNIMRGGIFAEEGRINVADFLSFTNTRNKALLPMAQDLIKKAAEAEGTANPSTLERDSLAKAAAATGNAQLKRLVLEYMPCTFSRRHGDPSRPWNKFNIKLNNDDGTPLLNYEGNWRDIFQNWEALAFSYPEYIQNMCAKFMNAMTADGFNPYRITRQGIDWEEPEPDNPWAQIGYWGDHQVIYLEKLLELYNNTDRAGLLASLDEPLYATANVPYRIKAFADLVKDPRNSIVFDHDLNNAIMEATAQKGTDAKLIPGADGQPALVSITSKLLQIIIGKAGNFIPGGGIWLNTQRPEWNDANNALAGYGLSIVTLCYLRRMLAFMIDIYKSTDIDSFNVPGEIANCIIALGEIYKEFDPEATATDSKQRRIFAEKVGLAFQSERETLYKNGFAEPAQKISRAQLLEILENIKKHAEKTISLNKREDGLYHAYNTMSISDTDMELSYLQEMLEGQVAVLSSGQLSPQEALDVFNALRRSRLFESRQYSYMLYPDKELPHFCAKNNITAKDVEPLAKLIERSGDRILRCDCNGIWHFCPDFRNALVMEEILAGLPEQMKPTAEENQILFALYEKTFNHQNFTGRSGTFYAYEGLGSIYWHMVAKLLLAAQENALQADGETAVKLAEAYYDVRKGIGFNKTPELYGVFPVDPYSHTPSGQGAKQPGMTGQVKEEVLTRWGELGVTIKDGCASFNPTLLKQNEFHNDGTLSFTWCGVPVTYTLVDKAVDCAICIKYADGNETNKAGTGLTKEESSTLFGRNGKIASIAVKVTLENAIVK
ncbi:MAG: hypothetical protein IKZ04_04665 [Spirochaetaceae bacterium]|nr:hypothetical protein [Spirochaetaceae bacterium]